MPSPQTVLYIRWQLAGLLAGFTLCAWIPVLPQTGIILVIAVTGLLGYRYCRGPLIIAPALMMSLAWAAWSGLDLIRTRLPLECVRTPVQLTGVVKTLPRKTIIRDQPRQRFEFELRQIEPKRCRGPVRLLLSYYGESEIAPGQHWQFETRLRRPWGLANPGSHNMQAWFAVSGIDALGSVAGEGVAIAVPDPQPAILHHKLRHKISSAISRTGIGGNAEAVLLAVTVADKSGIDHHLWRLLQQYGVNHLLVISGLHVGMVAAAGFVLGRALTALVAIAGLRPRWLPGLASLCLAFAYAALAGFSVATQRALFMLLGVAICQSLRRDSSPFTGLGLAALIILALNPLALLGSGFWLSFCAVTFLLWMLQWQKRGNRVYRTLSVHLSIALFMLPLGSIWFGGASVGSVLANAILVPFFGLFLVPLCLLGAVLELLNAPLSMLCWRVAAWPLQQLLDLAVFNGDGGLFQAVAPRSVPLVLAVLAAVSLVLPLNRWRRGMTLLLLLPLLINPVAHDYTRFVGLDVGQGTALVFLSGGRTLVYDTGGGNPVGSNMVQAVVLPYLRSQSIGTLDTLVISHGDIDHAAGAQNLLDELPVERYWRGGTGQRDSLARPCRAGQAWEWPDGTRFQFLSPASTRELSSNNASCVLRIEAAEYSLLIAGDIEKSQEFELLRYWGDALRADLLVAGHHGSKTSSSDTWLNHVRPDSVLLTYGYANRFGHPHPEVMTRLERHNLAIFRTASQGAVTFPLGQGGGMVATAERNRLKTWWK